VWDDIQRFYDAEAEEPARAGQCPAGRWEPDAPGVDEMPAWAVAGVWVTVCLVLFGAPAAGLGVGGLTAVGWALWRWWPQLIGAGTEAAPPADGEAEGPGRGAAGSARTSPRRRFRRFSGAE
jgi:hypothetical protein